MKNYIHLDQEKKKKRNFFVVINNKDFDKIYSDYTLKKVAKNVVNDLLGLKKNIIFYLREKGKSGKTYGPYIGNTEDGKIVVKSYKMSGGVIGQVYNPPPSPQAEWQKRKDNAAATAAAAAAAPVAPAPIATFQATQNNLNNSKKYIDLLNNIRIQINNLLPQ